MDQFTTHGACLFNPTGSLVCTHTLVKSKLKQPDDPKSYKIHDASSLYNVVGDIDIGHHKEGLLG